MVNILGESTKRGGPVMNWTGRRIRAVIIGTGAIFLLMVPWQAWAFPWY